MNSAVHWQIYVTLVNTDIQFDNQSKAKKSLMKPYLLLRQAESYSPHWLPSEMSISERRM
jgi:hypothetical protein